MNRGGFAEKACAMVIPPPENIDIETAGPLLCGGITVFKPLLTITAGQPRRLCNGACRYKRPLHAMGCEIVSFYNREQEVLKMAPIKGE